MSDKERKNKNADETLEIIEKILDYNKCAKNLFHRASSVNKKKSEPKTEENISEKSEQQSDQSIPKWVQVPKNEFDIIRSKINENKDMVTNIDHKRYTLNDASELINKIAEKRKRKIKIYYTQIKKMLKILNYLGDIFNGPSTERKGLKILTPNQMFRRLPITLTQLKKGNNFEILKNEIRQLLYSLHRSKKLTKQLYKSLIDII